MILFKTTQGHDLDELLSTMVKQANKGEIEIIQYSTCKEGLLFYLSYLYKRVNV